ncbi:hypothetical protein M378DRAFT_169769 [Amanita muscaria Koide BX008]|uniref:Uncharacterized protein n=1 Tax=Amanita muscaria (strain Koide BX008) TaxID=946122 RepID=A0A0C2WS23_AMAMK|nr:hypothetical protein M378DRAFT_169769 [Amanita muscaria Koide BX008]
MASAVSGRYTLLMFADVFLVTMKSTLRIRLGIIAIRDRQRNDAHVLGPWNGTGKVLWAGISFFRLCFEGLTGGNAIGYGT